MALLETSTDVLLKNQSRYGSFIACPNFHPYRFCWMRDSAYMAHALDLTGRSETQRFYRWAFKVVENYDKKVDTIVRKKRYNEEIKEDEYLHTRFTLRGHEDYDRWGQKQFDGYGSLLWAFAEHVRLSGEETLIDEYIYPLGSVVRYLLEVWKDPCYDVWEEYGDNVHLCTLSAIYGGLSHINKYLKEEETSKELRTIKKFITDNFVSDGLYRKMYDPSKNQSSGLDAMAISLFFPNAVVDAKDSVLANTVKEMEKELLAGGGLKRYTGDTYYGGNPWIVTTGMLALYYIENKKLEHARDLIGWIEDQSSNGLLPEQVYNSKYTNDPLRYQWWLHYWGQIASPLLWSHAMYMIAKRRLME